MPRFPARLRADTSTPWRARARRRLAGGRIPETGSTAVQEGFRWRNDDGSEATATWMAAQDTNATVAVGGAARLRTVIDTSASVTITPTLYYKKTTDSTWLPVPVGSGGSATTSARFDNVADILKVDPSPAPPPQLTFACWAYIDVDRDDWSSFIAWSGDGKWLDLGADASGNHVGVQAPGGGPGSVDMTPGTWYYIAASVPAATNAHFFYGTDAAVGSLTDAGNQFTTIYTTLSSFYIGGNGYNEWINGRVAFARVWDSVLTKAQLEAEMASTTPVITSGLWGNWPLQANANDTSPNARHLTTAGTVTYSSAGPAISTPNKVYIKTSSNITAGGQATTAQLAAPSGKTTADFAVGRMWDDENGTDSVTI